MFNSNVIFYIKSVVAIFAFLFGNIHGLIGVS
jgi:hypothetical protein